MTTRVISLAVVLSSIVLATVGCAPPAKETTACCSIERADSETGMVTVRVLETAEIVEFPAPLDVATKLKPGQMVTTDFIYVAVGRRLGGQAKCACGKMKDNSCWCTGKLPCCGPWHGCPIGSCKDVILTPMDR